MAAISRTLALLASAAAAALVAAPALAKAPAPAKRLAPAETVMLHGAIYTADRADSVQQALAIRNGRIAAVGSDRVVSRLIGPRTRVIDLAGRMAMPGLIDGHIHPFAGGRMLRSCNLEYRPLTVDQVLARIQACIDAEPKAGDDTILNVVGWYRQYMQPAGTQIDRQTLDRLNTRRPIAVTNRDMHSVLLNTRALALAGVTDATRDPAGGAITRDAAGHATGILEDAAISFLYKIMPRPVPGDDKRDLEAALHAMAQAGVTTFMDALASKDNVAVYRQVLDDGGLTARAHIAYFLGRGDEQPVPALVADAVALRRAFDRPSTLAAPTMRLDHVKLVMDGVIQAPAQTAGLIEPYWVPTVEDGHEHWAPGSNRGPIYIDADRLDALITGLAKAGIDPHVHAIGDRAVKLTLDAMELARKRVPGDSFRPAIAHAELVEPADYARFAKAGVLPVMSYQWSIPGPNSVTGAKFQLGPDRFERMEPFDKLVASGARMVYGSDWPVDRMNYWLALKGGIDRTGGRDIPAEFTGRLNHAPGLSRVQALRSITINGAYALHAEREVGSIEPGKLADVIVLDRDFLTMPEAELAENRVLLTLVGGKAVFAEGPFRAQ